MDIDVMQRQLRNLMKFRDDLLSIATPEGTQEAFDLTVKKGADRRAADAQAAAEAEFPQADSGTPGSPPVDEGADGVADSSNASGEAPPAGNPPSGS